MTADISLGSKIFDLVFLLDVDNTLLNNDRLKEDLDTSLREMLGPPGTQRFWEIYEQVRDRVGFVDFPRTIELMKQQYGEQARLDVENLFEDFPFRSYLYPHVMETIDYLKTIGMVVILSDGDPVFQPRKIQASGLAQAVDGRVIICVHKEEELDKVFSTYPAQHYVAVDDKPRIIAALEAACPSKFTTVLVLQGKYAQSDQYSPKADYVVQRIGDLRGFEREKLLALTGEATAN